MDKLDPRGLRDAFGSFMTGVTVVTTTNEDGTPVGFTANSFSSVSLDPPLLLVCPAKSLTCYQSFQESGRFAVNILSTGQEDLSILFARPCEDRFAEIEWNKSQLGNPLLSGVAARFDCKVHQWIDSGDHAVVIGEIVSFEDFGSDGLGYSKHGYFDLARERQASELQAGSARVCIGAIVEYQDEIFLLNGENGGEPRLPVVDADHSAGSVESIRNMLKETGLSVDIGSIYSIFENKGTGEYFIFYRAEATNGATPDVGSYHPMDPFLLAQFKDSPIKVMLTRYVTEHETNQFGLYQETANHGDVQLIQSK